MQFKNPFPKTSISLRSFTPNISLKAMLYAIIIIVVIATSITLPFIWHYFSNKSGESSNNSTIRVVPTMPNLFESSMTAPTMAVITQLAPTI